MAVVKSPKNKKHKKDWIKRFSILQQNQTNNTYYRSTKKKNYSPKNLHQNFNTNWKLNNWVLWNL